jgi:SOS-response transcriptional repressor LexA
MGDTLSHPAMTQGVAYGYLNTDLNARFISNKAATYLPLAPDDGIEGISVGDTLIVDRSLKPKAGRVILAEYCLRRLIRNGTALLLVDDKGYAPPRHVTESDYYHVTVTHNIHSQSW